jgi:hypothetical protein
MRQLLTTLCVTSSLALGGSDPSSRFLLSAKTSDGCRQATQEPGGLEPLSIGPASCTCHEVEVH